MTTLAATASASTTGGCHCFYSFTTPSKEANTASDCADLCKHFQNWFIFQNKNIFAHLWHLLCLNHELWQHSWLGDTVIYFMLRKCSFFSTLLYGNEIHWGVKYCSGRIPISQFRSEETNASTVADVAISCLTWRWGLETPQQNILTLWPSPTQHTHTQDSLLGCHVIRKRPLI